MVLTELGSAGILSPLTGAARSPGDQDRLANDVNARCIDRLTNHDHRMWQIRLISRDRVGRTGHDLSRRFAKRADRLAVLCFGLPICFARRHFQTNPVAYDKPTAIASYEPISFEHMHLVGDACAADSKRVGDFLMPNNQFVAVNPVMAHQQPPRETLIQ